MFIRRLIENLFRRPARRARATRFAEALEDRTLLTSNLNLIDVAGTANDRITLGGGSEANNYVITFDTGTGNYRIEDLSGAGFNVLGGLVDLDAAANVVEFNAAAAEAVTNFVRFDINGNLGDDIITINSFRAGDEGLNIIDGAGQGNDTVNINGDIGSIGSPVTANLVQIRTEDLNLGAGIYTNNLAITLGGTAGLNLTANSAVHAGTGAVTFDETVDGAFALDVIGGVVNFNQDVGFNTPVAGLTAVGSSSLKTQDVTATSVITIQTDSYNPQGSLNGSGTADLTIRRNTAGTQTFTADSFPFVAPGFNSVTIGSALTTTLNINSDGDNNVATGSFGFDADVTLIGGSIFIRDTIQQAANSITFVPETDLTFTGIGRAVGTGDVVITKQTAGGTVTVAGNIGFNGVVNPWGSSALIVNAAGSTATFTGGVGSSFASISATADTLNFNHPSAVTAQGDITLVGDVNLNGGITSFNGNVLVLGGLNLTGNTLFKAGFDRTIGFANDVTANGFNMLFRGNDEPLGFVQINGDVIGAGQFRVDGSGVNTADQIILNDVSATNIVLRATTQISLFGDITSSTSVNIVGPVFLTAPGATVNITNGGLATHLMQFSGTINGGNTLNINSGLARTTFTAAIGGVTPLANLTVNSGGLNTITQPITVIGDVNWTVGTDGNGLNDRITRSGAGAVNAGGNITLIADVITGEIVGTNINAGGVATITERGAGN